MYGVCGSSCKWLAGNHTTIHGSAAKHNGINICNVGSSLKGKIVPRDMQAKGLDNQRPAICLDYVYEGKNSRSVTYRLRVLTGTPRLLTTNFSPVWIYIYANSLGKRERTLEPLAAMATGGRCTVESFVKLCQSTRITD